MKSVTRKRVKELMPDSLGNLKPSAVGLKQKDEKKKQQIFINVMKYAK